MKAILALIKREQRYFGVAALFLGIIFAIALIQNIIRYGIHESYNPWKSVLYLCISLLLFYPLLPFILFGLRKAYFNYKHYFTLLSIGVAFLSIGCFYIISSSLIHLLGFYDDYFTIKYARQYFGREALYHVFLIVGTVLYVWYFSKGPSKLISGTVGKKEIVIQSKLIHWIEADDHYLKIYIDGQPLIKRYTLEKMAQELAPDFIRIHRKYLVNKKRIIGKERIQRNEFVLLQSGKKLKVGRSYSPLEI